MYQIQLHYLKIYVDLQFKQTMDPFGIDCGELL